MRSEKNAQTTDPRDSLSPFGVLDFLPWDHDWNDHHYGGSSLERTLDLMKEAGVAFVRMDFLWSDIEPKRGEFNFSKYDRIVELVQRRGICILGLLLYSPRWEGRPWNEAPQPQSYVHYASQVVRRYKEHVRHWEIWNEPDHLTYWQPQDNLAAYSRLLRQVYTALKEIDPSCQVHMAGLSQAVPHFLRSLYEKAGRETFDVAHIHPYIHPATPDALNELARIHQAVLEIMEEYGDGQKPIWISELGCPGMRDLSCAPNWWLGKNVSEEEQSQWVRAVYGKPLQWKNVEKIFWAFFRDTDCHFKTGADFFGLINKDFTKKPAFYAYCDMERQRLAVQR